MNRKIFTLIAVMLFTAVISGGCGGSGGTLSLNNDDNSSTTPDNSAKFYMLGSLEDSRLKDSDIASHINKVISIDNFSDIADISSSDNVLIIDDVSKLTHDSTYEGLENADIRTAYDEGLIIAALYPDSEDIIIICDILGIDTPPELDSKSHFEIFVVGWREVDGDYEPFSYIIADMDEFTSGDIDETVYRTTSQDEGSIITSSDIVYESGDQDFMPEDFTDEAFNIIRINDFLEWVKILNTNPDNLYATYENEQNQSEINTSSGTGQLTEIAKSEGPDMININYYTNIKFRKIKGAMEDAPLYKNSTGLRAEYDSWRANRRTNLKYDVYSIHSFDKNRDYFLIRAHNSTNTKNQFASVINSNAYTVSPGNSDARLMYGFTRKLTFNHYIEQDTGNGSVAIVASAPDNKAASQTTSTTMGYSFGAKVGLAANITKGEISATAEFSYSINYSSTVSNTAIDYEIARSHNDDNSFTPYNPRANAKWIYTFSWPKEGKDIGTWSTRAPYCYRELEAWPSSLEHTSHLEWIWEINPSIWKSYKNKLTVKANVEWVDGLTQGKYHRRLGTYWGDRIDIEANKYSKDYSFTIKRPPHLAVRPASFAPSAGSKAFDKNAGNAKIVLLSEGNWSASITKGSDWLTGLTPANGSATGANEQTITFSYSANNTGSPRAGTIRITNTEGDIFDVQVTQGSN